MVPNKSLTHPPPRALRNLWMSPNLNFLISLCLKFDLFYVLFVVVGAFVWFWNRWFLLRFWRSEECSDLALGLSCFLAPNLDCWWSKPMICGMSGSRCESARRTVGKSKNYWKFWKTRETSVHLTRSRRLKIPAILSHTGRNDLKFVDMRIGLESSSNFSAIFHGFLVKLRLVCLETRTNPFESWTRSLSSSFKTLPISPMQFWDTSNVCKSSARELFAISCGSFLPNARNPGMVPSKVRSVSWPANRRPSPMAFSVQLRCWRPLEYAICWARWVDRSHPKCGWKIPRKSSGSRRFWVSWSDSRWPRISKDSSFFVFWKFETRDAKRAWCTRIQSLIVGQEVLTFSKYKRFRVSARYGVPKLLDSLGYCSLKNSASSLIWAAIVLKYMTPW